MKIFNQRLKDLYCPSAKTNETSNPMQLANTHIRGCRLHESRADCDGEDCE